MSMSKKDEKLEINKKQLLHEGAFIEYCNYDYYRHQKLPNSIYEPFLRAAEKDELIKPILKEKEKIRQADGTEKSGVVRYYSPFQIYMVAALANNKIDDGYLRSPDDFEWQKERGFRMINWGGWSSFNIENKRNYKKWDDFVHNQFLIADYFDSFLRFLHTLKYINEDDAVRYDRQRHFREDYPSLQFDLEQLKSGGKKLLQSYGLNEKKLQILRKSVGYFATHIDPLEHWYYYLEKHPQWRKDKLKGVAIVAQDLYRLCDLIADMLEILTGKKQKPLLEFLHPDIKPMAMEGIDYAKGLDFKAVSIATKKFRDWLSRVENKRLIKRVEKNLPATDGFTFDEIEKELSKIEENLADFEKRYSKKERRYVGNMREIKGDEIVGFDDLDEDTKKRVQSTMERHKSVLMDERGETHFRTSWDDVMDKLNKKEITLQEAEKLDYERELKAEIEMAIERRLDDIRRDLWGLPHKISRSIYPEITKIEEEQKKAEQELWRKFRASVPEEHGERPDGRKVYTEAYQNAFRKFRDGELQRGRRPYQQKINQLKGKQDELAEIHWFSDLVLCAICREAPVQLHYGWGDKQVSAEVVCDSCFHNINNKALDIDLEEWKKIKEGEWECKCGERILYKYALGNTISLWTKAGIPIKLEVVYGKAILEAKCPHCGRKSQRNLDWGWLP